ncbi:hypothetical protein DSCW_46200 [Desulfosarcina widdelii]|uniref:Uncharacterized protein n=1 Tax=Desulfosarcina widdelii TaxID=947919 RepID=A0A5K7ZBR6_9BACT|nr:hypothetical protein [Desulfosarcina widdelii]BBO77203.1 hypothetical protein DSCW_46200 [Desulfosarcina widdelii]
MIDRIETHPTAEGYNNINLRSGKDRRKGYSVIDPDMDRRKRERRKNDKPSGGQESAWSFLKDSAFR